MTTITTLSGLSIFPGFEWLGCIAGIDLDDPSPGSRSLALPLVAQNVGAHDGLSREIAQPNHVVVFDVGVGNPDAISHIHSASPSAQVVQTHGQETMEPFADVRKVFEKFANSHGG
ncbi:hypothetical protein [Pseudochelatococcus contaminans]|uniref:Uncharacterized protein n=1 Tax=Pseudochelatococcus contaminans TaxID=1538103 RepID=A0A7W5Z2B9_9HYPH|nr:hypothetical protein [Pseudochelatococcus contaminans]MBB3808782.1 hypothetical protein [Pseudochelatococcus contaminans]